MRRRRTFGRVLCLLLAGVVGNARADVRVSPVAAYLNDEHRTERILVENLGPAEKEVTIEVRFGYPVSDDSGRVSLRFLDEPGGNEPSAVKWIQVFPESFTLPAGESQVVALISTPPPDLQEGEYWARPVLSFRTAMTHDVESGLALSVNYRHGSVWTGVSLNEVTVVPTSQTLLATFDMNRKGNAAFLGNLICRLKSVEGIVIHRETTKVAVYHSLKQKIGLPLQGRTTGACRLEVELNTNRQGNNPGDILQSASVVRTLEFVSNRTATPSDKVVAAKAEASPTTIPVYKKSGNRGQAKRADDVRDALKRVREMEALLVRMLDDTLGPGVK